MEKQLFIECIAELKKQHRHNEAFTRQIEKLFEAECVMQPKTHWVFNQLVKVLQVQMADNHKDSWIEYYISELDFGRKYRPGTATYKDGRNINLSTPAALYDFLLTEKQTK